MIADFNTKLEQWYKSHKFTHQLVLEAGGGSFAHFTLPEQSSLITLDIEFGQLKNNFDVKLKIQGDLHSLPVKPHSVDMIICFNVIEHLDKPELALEQMSRALKPEGVILLGCPNRSSLKGLITWLTPYAFHRWYYQRILKKKDRGDGHFDVFPTPFRKIVAEKPLLDWFKNKHYQLEYFEKYDGVASYNIVNGSLKARLFGLIYYSVGYAGKILTLGLWDPFNTDLLLLARKTNNK